MFDLSVRLRESPHLLALLSHYARKGADDRTVWQDRLMEMEGIDAKHLTTLHGELIAFDGIEQNTGHALFKDGVLTACYRVTQQGLRAFRRQHGIVVAEEVSEPAEAPQPRVPRKKKGKNEAQAVATSE